MQHALELASRSAIAECAGPHPRSVKRAIAGDGRRAESGPDCVDRSASRLSQLMREGVGIDDSRAMAQQHARDGALSASDAACQADAEERPAQSGRKR
jgi:hypothetical protein